mmetsp:Transcript_6684/g.11920  ORF Transcript_6684/g.11920 Transcript_6684/m.11920 type:complete len:217 (+) Transcript_6684:111-761(+)
MSSKLSSPSSSASKFSSMRTTSSTCQRCASWRACPAVFAVAFLLVPPVYTSSMNKLTAAIGQSVTEMLFVESSTIDDLSNAFTTGDASTNMYECAVQFPSEALIDTRPCSDLSCIISAQRSITVVLTGARRCGMVKERPLEKISIKSVRKEMMGCKSSGPLASSVSSASSRISLRTSMAELRADRPFISTSKSFSSLEAYWKLSASGSALFVGQAP